MHMTYVLSTACGIAYLVTVIAGDAWPALGAACFVAMIVAVVRDRSLTSR
jgi:hypothetical protein